MGAVASDDGDQADADERPGQCGDCGSVDVIRRRCGWIGKAVANENPESDFVDDYRDPIGWRTNNDPKYRATSLKRFTP